MLNIFQWSCNTYCILPIAFRFSFFFFFFKLLQPSSGICLQSNAGSSLLHSTYCRKVLVSGLFLYSHQDVPLLSKACHNTTHRPFLIFISLAKVPSCHNIPLVSECNRRANSCSMKCYFLVIFDKTKNKIFSPAFVCAGFCIGKE